MCCSGEAAKQSETEGASTLMVARRDKARWLQVEFWQLEGLSRDGRVSLLQEAKGCQATKSLSLWGVCNAVFIRTITKRMAIHSCTNASSPEQLSHLQREAWSSLHPLSLFAHQSQSLSAVIFGSFRTASLSFTLGSISMSLERISKARGRYIIQAWSSCPGLILTQSQVGHMLQLNSPSPYLNVVSTDLSPLVDLRESHKKDTVLPKSFI